MLVGPVGLYALAAVAAAVADGRSPIEVVCFEPARFGTFDQPSVGRLMASVAMAVGAVAFLFVVPGLLGMLAFLRLPRTRATAHAWSLIVNSAALILLCLVLRHTAGIGRVSLAAGWLGWTTLLFALTWQPGRSHAVLEGLWQRYGGGLLLGLLAAVVAIVTFFPEQFLQCLSDDGAEVYELARSLRGHFLPYWELEAWRWEIGNRMGTVVVNPSLINSYWTCGLQALLGGIELPTRLPYWVWWTGVFAVSYRMVRPRPGRAAWTAAVPLALLIFLMNLWFTFYVGYNQYLADIGNPGVTDALCTLGLLLAFDCLRREDGWGFVLSMTLASLVLYAGPVLLLTTLAAAWTWRPIERRDVARWGLRAAGLLLAIAAFYLARGWSEGSLPAWLHTVDIEYVNDYLAPAPRWKSGPVFFGYFLLGCGVIPAWGLLRAFRRDRWQRTVATATLLYLLVVLLSGFKNLHYLCPLLPVPVILFLMDTGPNETPAEGGGVRRPLRRAIASRFAAAAGLIICIVLCWPKARVTFTLNRDLGAATAIATDSYFRALQWARVRLVLIEEGKVSWYYGAHCWVTYAKMDPSLAGPRPLVLTAGAPPPGYLAVASRRVEGSDSTATLYAENRWWTRWLTTRPVRRPPERYPAIMQPIAEGPYSPHRNRLEDVQRLHWPR